MCHTFVVASLAPATKEGGWSPTRRHRASMINRYHLIRAMGVTVVPVEALPDAACYVESQRVVLVRPDLDRAQQEELYDWLIHQAAPVGPSR